MTSLDGWELVIGLEVHCELKTATKLFCGCPNMFGDEPNTNVCPVCLGLPGSLPVLNRHAVELAMRIGAALNCSIEPSTFHRKNYFYPDMPKDYQVSQYDEPINVGGYLDLPDGFRVGIERAHMEEDTGKTVHIGGAGRIHGSTTSLVDYNRSGVPLVEIVSAPDMRTSEQARAYVAELRAILVAIGASDGRMEEGSLRADANVSVRRPGEPLGTRCEIKNVNSLRSLGRAIEYEARRQVDLITSGEKVQQQTRHWDDANGRTITGRTKEEAEDYRYFLEPDLVPLAPDSAWIQDVRGALATLPAARRGRVAAAAGAEPASQPVVTVVDLELDELVCAAVAAGADGRIALARAANEVAADVEAGRRLDAAAFAALVQLEAAGSLTATQAKTVLSEMLEAGGGDPAAIAAAHGFEAMDTSALDSTLDEIVAAHPDEWTRYCEGDPKMQGFFVGLVMKASQGKANGKAVTAALQARCGQ